MILYESDYKLKHRPEWRDFSEPLLLGADHQLFFSFSFRSTLNSQFNPSTLGSWPASSPWKGPGLTVYLAWLLFSGLAWSINRFLTWVLHKTVNFDKRGRRGSWRNNKKNSGGAKITISTQTYLHSRKDKIFSPMLQYIVWIKN